MRMKKWKCFAAAAGAACLLMACGGSEPAGDGMDEELEALGEIKVITRESGSGTRSSFAQTLGLSEEGVDDKDYISEAAETVTSGEEVVSAVAGDKSAVGYVSWGTDISGNEDVKELSVDGVQADEQTIGSGQYPLDRTLYLASQDDQNALKEDFLTYVTGKGQEIVGEFFVPAEEGKEVFLSSQPSGTLRIHGSTSLAPVVEALAEAYEEANPNADIQVTASDSSQGITDTLTGDCDMAMVSRELYDYERDVLEPVPVAKDGIRIIVQASNPLEDVAVGTLADIYRGDTARWADAEED